MIQTSFKSIVLRHQYIGRWLVSQYGWMDGYIIFNCLIWYFIMSIFVFIRLKDYILLKVFYNLTWKSSL